MTTHRPLRAAAAGAVAVALVAVACERSPKPGAQGAGSARASASADVMRAVPVPATEIEKVVNPGGQPAYSGPIGTVRGSVSVTGDPAPERPDTLARIPGECAEARTVYGKLFREGMMRSLADVLVGVTGYEGYLPEREPAQRVEARGCGFGPRTIALTYGQRIDVVSKDGKPYLPSLLGGTMPAQMVAVPGGDAVELYPNKPGRYQLTDTLHPFIDVDVFVLKYPTTAVTGLDGKFEITGVPTGKLKVSAVLPATLQTAEKEVTVVAGQAVDVELEIRHSAPTADAAAPAASGARPGSSAAPAASGKLH